MSVLVMPHKCILTLFGFDLSIIYTSVYFIIYTNVYFRINFRIAEILISLSLAKPGKMKHCTGHRSSFGKSQSDVRLDSFEVKN